MLNGLLQLDSEGALSRWTGAGVSAAYVAALGAAGALLVSRRDVS